MERECFFVQLSSRTFTWNSFLTKQKIFFHRTIARLASTNELNRMSRRKENQRREKAEMRRQVGSLSLFVYSCLKHFEKFMVLGSLLRFQKQHHHRHNLCFNCPGLTRRSSFPSCDRFECGMKQMFREAKCAFILWNSIRLFLPVDAAIPFRYFALMMILHKTICEISEFHLLGDQDKTRQATTPLISSPIMFFVRKLRKSGWWNVPTLKFLVRPRACTENHPEIPLSVDFLFAVLRTAANDLAVVKKKKKLKTFTNTTASHAPTVDCRTHLLPSSCISLAWKVFIPFLLPHLRRIWWERVLQLFSLISTAFFSCEF